MNSPFKAHAAAIGLLLLIGVLDIVTGPELGFFIFYFIPVAIVAWHFGHRAPVYYSLGAIIVWFVSEEMNQGLYSKSFYLYWNGAIRLASFLIIGFLVARTRTARDRERELLNKELTRSQEEVKQLSGLLPICASCKQIRDDQGYWHQVESYIRSHSAVEFSHSICPVCVERLYPEYKDQINGK